VYVRFLLILFMLINKKMKFLDDYSFFRSDFGYIYDNDPMKTFRSWLSGYIYIGTPEVIIFSLATNGDKFPLLNYYILKGITKNEQLVFYKSSTDTLYKHHNKLCTITFLWSYDNHEKQSVTIKGEITKAPNKLTNYIWNNRTNESKKTAHKLNLFISQDIESIPIGHTAYVITPVEYIFSTVKNDRNHNKHRFYKDKYDWQVEKIKSF
jgi:pyridoxine/pyridoxamine 5'-phosphate oxidase